MGYRRRQVFGGEGRLSTVAVGGAAPGCARTMVAIGRAGPSWRRVLLALALVVSVLAGSVAPATNAVAANHPPPVPDTDRARAMSSRVVARSWR